MDRIALTFPDLSHMDIYINEGESFTQKTRAATDNWYKITNEDPDRFDHFDIIDKCPNCGGPMRCKIVDKQSAIWCLNPKCGYQRVEDNLKARERVFKKVGIKKAKRSSNKGTILIFH